MTRDARFQMMLDAVPVEELTPQELKLIKWLAEWDDSVAKRFASIAGKIRNERMSAHARRQPRALW